MFAAIRLRNWRQFSSVNLRLDSPMTVITGANGSGKTTILHILSRHFGWNLPWTSTRTKRSERRFWADAHEEWIEQATPRPNSITIGEIEYANGGVCTLHVPTEVSEQYSVSYDNQQNVPGIHIPSHTQPFSFQKIESIPTDPKTSAQQFQEYQSLLIQLYNANKSQNPGKAIKSSLIALAVFGFGNQAVMENTEFRDIFVRLQEALRILLPREIGFQRMEVRMPEVFLMTTTGMFSLDSISGGIGALVGIAWQILMYGLDKGDFVVTFDEPENHLHPAMQRELLGNLERAFPRAHFIISTHSPFIVTSNPHATIYCLKYADGKVVSEQLTDKQRSGDYNDTLRDVLGVPVTIPPWVESTIAELYRRVTQQGVTHESIAEFRHQLQELGLYPQLPFVADKLEAKDA